MVKICTCAGGWLLTCTAVGNGKKRKEKGGDWVLTKFLFGNILINQMISLSCVGKCSTDAHVTFYELSRTTTGKTVIAAML